MSRIAVCAFLYVALQGLQPPPDFALRLAYGLCTTDVLDTFQGTFTRDLGPLEHAVTIPITLPAEMTQQIFTEIASARFAEYPEAFFVRGGGTRTIPAMHYSLETRVGGASHAVTWTDDIRPSTPEADGLRDLFKKLIVLIATHPDVKALPQAKVGCI